MANDTGHGGYRTPAHPASVSGPGALSQRTDGGPGQPSRYIAGLPYGQGQETMSMQSSAPMAKAASPKPNTRLASAAPPGAGLTPLDAPTDRPDEPVTEGNPMGAGAGPGALSNGVGSMRDASAHDAMQLKAYLPALIQAANMPNTPTSFVRFVHYLRNV